MRVYNTLAFDEFIDGNGVRYSSAFLNDHLGQAEKLVVHWQANKITGTSPTLLAWIEHSNDGKDWQTAWTFASSVNLNTSFFGVAGSGAVVFGGLLRIAVGLGGTAPAAQIHVTVCGRAEEAVGTVVQGLAHA